MFTGLIQELGRVESVEASDEGARLRVAAELAAELRPGDSVSVNGACLTATSAGGGTLEGVSLTVAGLEDPVVEVSLIPVTLERTTLGRLDAGDRLNVECDVLARYVRRQVADSGMSPLSAEQEH